MATRKQLIATLKEIEETSEHGPWLLAESDTAFDNWVLCFGNDYDGKDIYVTTYRVRVSEAKGNGARAEAQAIVTLRNLLPSIIRELEAEEPGAPGREE